MQPAQEATATSVTIITLGYRARCTERGCRNLGRMILDPPTHATSGNRLLRLRF
jgi:hypothetical protein